MKGFKIKYLFVFGILLWHLNGYSQEKHFRLIGEVKGIDTGSVSIYSLLQDTSKKNSFSSQVLNGRFVLEGDIDNPLKVFLILNNSLYTEDFFIDLGNQNIYFDATNINNFSSSMKITGSLINDEYKNNYQNPLADYFYRLDSCYIVLDSLNKFLLSGEALSGLANLCDAVSLVKRKIDSVKKAFIIEHPASYVSLWVLYISISFIENLEFVIQGFDYLDDEVKNSATGKHLNQRIQAEKAFLTGEIFPDMHLVDSMENNISIANKVKGKYTLIDFWYSKCGPCIAQFPTIRYLYDKYKIKGFDVIGITVDKRIYKKDWLSAISKHKLEWGQYWDFDGKEKSKYFFDTYPTNFLLDSDGKIIKKNILLEELYIFLEKL